MDMILMGVIGIYVAWATFYGIKLVRSPLMNWYNSQSFFVSGSGPVDIFIKQIGFKLGWEAFVLGASAIVGSLGGAVYLAFFKKSEQNESSDQAESQT
ncbi:hypothetical protein WDW89_00370 [Deltaproteobacteria bacterium TL4]